MNMMSDVSERETFLRCSSFGVQQIFRLNQGNLVCRWSKLPRSHCGVCESKSICMQIGHDQVHLGPHGTSAQTLTQLKNKDLFTMKFHQCETLEMLWCYFPLLIKCLSASSISENLKKVWQLTPVTKWFLAFHTRINIY